MGFERLSEILKKARQMHPAFSQRLAEADAFARWELAVGPMIAKHARPVKVHRKELWVEVDHPIWRSELHHRKKQILDKLNAVELPEPVSKGKSKSSSQELKDPKAKCVIEDILLMDPRR